MNVSEGSEVSFDYGFILKHILNRMVEELYFAYLNRQSAYFDDLI